MDRHKMLPSAPQLTHTRSTSGAYLSRPLMASSASRKSLMYTKAKPAGMCTLISAGNSQQWLHFSAEHPTCTSWDARTHSARCRLMPAGLSSCLLIRWEVIPDSARPGCTVA